MVSIFEISRALSDFLLATKSAKKTPVMINESGENIANEIVSGGLYPSCVACHKAGEPCEWRMVVIHLRLTGVHHKAKNCERCVPKKGACNLIWERENLKRAAEDAVEPDSSPKVLRLECPDVVSVLSHLNANIGTLVKITAASSAKAARDYAATAEKIAEVQSSLEGLHEKYNEFA